MGKKGTHTGFVMSFIIFVMSLLFLYAIFGPQIINFGKQPTNLNLVKDGLIEQIYVNVTSSSIKLNSAIGNGQCASVDITPLNFLSRVIVIDEKGERRIADFASGGVLEIAEGNSGSSNERFFRIYNSSAFDEEDNNDLSNCNSKNYDLGLVKTEKIISYSKAIEFIDFYKQNSASYNDLKNALGVSGEMAVSFVYDNRTEIKMRGDFPNVNVFVSEFPIKYINSNGEIKAGGLKIYSW